VPLFQFILIHHVVIDSLHLFLRISGNLINKLIRDLTILDSIEKAQKMDRMKAKNLVNYEQSCKIHFNFYSPKDIKAIKW